MTSVLYITPVTLIVIILSITIDTCKAGLKNQRNFAHVYGKRGFSDGYNAGLGGQSEPKFPAYSEFPVDYETSDDKYQERREDPKVNVKANVGHMFGRELYDNYPAYRDFGMYDIPEMEEENIVEIPNVKNDEMINIPINPDHMQHKSVTERERLLLRNLLRASPAARMGTLAYLDSIVNDRRRRA